MTGGMDAHWAASMMRGRAEPSRLDRFGERAAAVGVGLLIVTGFASSYTTLRDLAVEVGGFSPWLAPVVPLSFDLGIVVLSLKVILAARAGRDARVLRVLVLLLSAATVAANGAASADDLGRLLHAVPPAMFVVCFETLASSARNDAHTRWAAARHDATAGEVLTAMRWLLAPRQTWTIWRDRVLGSAPHSLTLSVSVPVPTASGWAATAEPGRVLQADLAAETATLPSSTGVSHAWPVNDPSSSPAVVAGPLRPPFPAGRGDSAPAETGSAGQHARLAVAVEALQADPAMTAVALAEHLGGAGHAVSVRTAQRVRQQAEQHLAPRPQDTDASFTAGVRDGQPG